MELPLPVWWEEFLPLPSPWLIWPLLLCEPLQVSEQFARYIDVWIQKSWADSGNVETLRRLQRSLEPVLFLSGLELANTFEHFYR